LIVVDSGQVEVESEGKAVQLTADEGVEVQPGEPPGDKFVVQRDQIDYRTWNDDKLEAMLADPVLSVDRLQDRMDYYIQNVEENFTLYQDYKQQLTATRNQLRQITKEKGRDAGRQFNLEQVLPLAAKANNLHLNVRYYALAALSLRRYVGSRLYLFVKARTINAANKGEFSGFAANFDEWLAHFERDIVPHLNELDI
jgi:hypothetical protein